MKRIAVVGTTGSGKTTLARKLAGVLDVPHVELDAIHWGPDWKAADTPAFRERVEEALAGDRWVVDGNYSAVRDIVWARADTVVWLDYSVGTVLRRLLTRTFRRVLGWETLWNGNKERFWVQFATRESLVLWMLETHWKYRARYSVMLAAPEHTHLRGIRLSSPRETARWLTSLGGRHGASPPADATGAGAIRPEAPA